MALFNYATKEITIKIVYYGPGLSGKTTNLQYLHSILAPDTKGKLLSLATEADRTLFFDFLPLELGKLRDFSIRFQLYTVPGQVRYNSTRKLVLRGADAIVFVADSQREMREQNIESLKNMWENLIENNINPDDTPLIFQYNKRDIPNILSIDELNKDLNENNKYKYTESIAINGTGVEDTFKLINKTVLKGIAERHKIKMKSKEEIVGADSAEISDMEPKEELVDANIAESSVEEISTEVPIMDSLRYVSSEKEQPTYGIPGIKEAPTITVVEDKIDIPREIIVKEIREVPIIPQEKLDMVINGINDISQTLKELKNAASKIHVEIKELIKEQRDANIVLRNIRDNFENVKTKKSWFRFS